MGSPSDDRLGGRDAVLLIVECMGGVVSGRTTLQKLAYFVSRRSGIDLDYHAHFYGPFSSSVEDATMLCVIADELDETIKRWPDWRGGPDVRQYIYALTDLGRERVAELRSRSTELSQRIDETLAIIKRAVPTLSQRTLSTAAKVHLIVRQSEGPISTNTIPSFAGELGWTIEKSDVDQTVQLLAELGLVSRGTPAAG